MTSTFGRRLLTVTPTKALELEREAGLAGKFEDLDRLLGDMIHQSLGGARLAALTRTRARGTELELGGITGRNMAWIREARSLEALQSHGFWSTPQKTSLKVGVLSTAWSLRERGRFGPQISAEERGPVPLDTAEAITVWSILTPALSEIYQPIYLRTIDAGSHESAKQLEMWGSIAETIKSIGISSLDAFEAIRYGGGWSQLSAAQRHEALLAYAEGLLVALPPDVGSRLRLHLARPLLEKYYARAKKDGTALQKRVVTAALRPVFAGVWGGSWLDFVNYLGEELHAREHIATAMPAVALTSSPAVDMAAVAKEMDVPLEDVAAVVAAVFGPEDNSKRIGVLKRFWQAFDEAHTRQRPGMTPLWGLVDDGHLGPRVGDGPYSPGLYRTLVASSVNEEIDSLWGGHMWTRFPDRITSEWSPHARMADAFGPALPFWQGVALTAWFICEGPLSRTDFPGLPEYHARELAALEDAGTPIDTEFLRQITKAERLLGPPEEVVHNRSATAIEGTPFSIAFDMDAWSRRPGFEAVRDLITNARRAWAERYLDIYLERRWKQSIEGAGERYHIAVNARAGKPPTAKMFAREAADAVNHWLGGDLGEMYRILKEKAPIQTSDGRCLTRPPHVALMDLHTMLTSAGGQANSHRDFMAKRLLQPATTYIRWLEATGEPPSVEKIKDFQYYAEHHFNAHSEASWSQFVELIHEACLEPRPEHGRGTTEAVRGGALDPSTVNAQQPAQDVSRPARRPWWRRLFGLD